MTKKTYPSYLTHAANLIKQVYKHQQKIALTNFMHDITFGQGQISMLVSNKEIFDFYCKNKIPMLCTDESGRNLEEGIYLNKTLENTYSDCSQLMPLLPKVAVQFQQNYGKNSVHFVMRESDCQHLFSLFFDSEEKEFLHWVVNNGHFMRDLVDEYKVSAADLILEAKAVENRVILPNSSDYCFSPKNNSDSRPINVIHKKLNIPIHLSNQQSKCLSLLFQGNSIKKIALILKLSHRTVEHYLENIRRQLGCTSNKELIALYGEQFFRS